MRKYSFVTFHFASALKPLTKKIYNTLLAIDEFHHVSQVMEAF